MFLYESNACNRYDEEKPTNYYIKNEFTSTPICSLPDTLSGTVKRTISEEDVLEFSYPSSGTNAHEIQLRRIIECKADPYRQTQYFRILSIDVSIDGTMDVYAKHIVYDLRNVYNYNFACAMAKTSIEEFQKYINEYLYEYIGNGYVSVYDYQALYSSGAFRYNLSNDITLPSGNDLFERIGIEGFADFGDIIFSSNEGSILSVLSGEMEFDRYNIIHKKNIGQKRGYSIEYGKNLTGFNYTSDTQRLYTDIMPYWTGTVNDAGVIKENYIRYVTNHYDSTTNHINFYGYDFNLPAFDSNYTYAKMLSQRLIPIYYYDSQGNKKRFSYTKYLPVDISEIYNSIHGIDNGTPIDIPAREDVAKCGIYYAIVNGLGKTSMSMSIDFVDLMKNYSEFSEAYELRLGDIVTIINPIANVSGEAEVVSTTYNVLTDRYESIELGDIKVSLAEILSDSNKKTYYNKIIRN